MSANQNHTGIEEALTEAHRVLSLVDDVGAAFAASPDVVMGTESWWLLGELAYDAKKGLDAAYAALPGSITVTRLDDLAGPRGNGCGETRHHACGIEEASRTARGPPVGKARKPS